MLIHSPGIICGAQVGERSEGPQSRTGDRKGKSVFKWTSSPLDKPPSRGTQRVLAYMQSSILTMNPNSRGGDPQRMAMGQRQ